MQSYNKELISIETLYDYVDKPQSFTIEEQKNIAQHLAQHEMDRHIVEAYKALKSGGIDKQQIDREYQAHQQRFSAYIQKNEGKHKRAFYAHVAQKWVKERFTAFGEGIKFLINIIINPKYIPVPLTMCAVILFGIGIWTINPSLFIGVSKPEIDVVNREIESQPPVPTVEQKRATPAPVVANSKTGNTKTPPAPKPLPKTPEDKEVTTIQDDGAIASDKTSEITTPPSNIPSITPAIIPQQPASTPATVVIAPPPAPPEVPKKIGENQPIPQEGDGSSVTNRADTKQK